jgi:excinuclease ABC subunit C
MDRPFLFHTEVLPRFDGFGPWKLAPHLPCGSDRLLLASDAADARRQVRRHVPLEPGVYGMLDAAGELVYVGQSHALRNRLLSYLGAAAPYKAQRIIGHTHTLIWETVPDAFAAPLLELELIRRWRPRFNVRGQPGRKRSAYVAIGRGPAPHVYLSADAHAPVFGPIRASRLARRAVELLNDTFQLRTCGNRVTMQFSNERTLFDLTHNDLADDGGTLQPTGALCMRYDLGSCLGPCASLCSDRQYADRVLAMQRFLQGDDDSPLDRLESAMLTAAADRRYEQAGALRDAYHALHYLRNQIERLRDARQNYRFVYRLAGASGTKTWYFIYRGQVIGAMPEPKSPAEVLACRAMLARLEDDQAAAAAAAPDDDFEMQWIVSHWFRRHAKHLKQTRTPAAIRRWLSRAA